MTDVCKGCGAERRRWKQWYRRDADVWCPTCAPEDMRAERCARKRELASKIASKRPADTIKRELADRAAKVVLDEDVSRRNAMERFGIGWVTLCAAIAKLRAERAAVQAGGAR